jgi:hypothetical protein
MGAVFESMREAWRDAMSRASSPAEGRAVLAMMRDALVDAKVGVSQVRAAIDKTRVQLEHERSELETAMRRGRMAADIHDDETSRIAERYAAKHRERVGMLERKVEAQTSELSLAEQELSEMTDQFHAMASGGGATGTGARPGGASPAGAGLDSPNAGLDADLAGLERAADRSAREADAERRLEELKRRMGR